LSKGKQTPKKTVGEYQSAPILLPGLRSIVGMSSILVGD
jgi:hypothetical protein